MLRYGTHLTFQLMHHSKWKTGTCMETRQSSRKREENENEHIHRYILITSNKNIRFPPNTYAEHNRARSNINYNVDVAG